MFLRNGARLYLDVGSHPEYASAECDDVHQLVVNDRAGERILDEMTEEANALLAEEGIAGTVHLFKNNIDSAGNSFGCHENYLVRRQGDFAGWARPSSRSSSPGRCLTGAGKICPRPRGGAATPLPAGGPDLGVELSATTRSRPIINTRDEPHARRRAVPAHARHRRGLVDVRDHHDAQGRHDRTLLRLIEAGVPMRDLGLAEPMRAIREITHDITGTAPVDARDRPHGVAPWTSRRSSSPGCRTPPTPSSS